MRVGMLCINFHDYRVPCAACEIILKIEQFKNLANLDAEPPG